MLSVAEVVNRHLRRGDRVRLADWGMMKLEIESIDGTQALYNGITFEKDKTYNP